MIPIELPVGPVVDPTPAQLPGPVNIAARFGMLMRLDAARHCETLWEAVHGHEKIWAYLSYGPMTDFKAFSNWLGERGRLKDPYYYAVLDADGRAVGLTTLVNIQPAMRAVEVGHILYSPGLQRTALATEAQYMLARYVFETLLYRRYEWKCNALNRPSYRAGPALWLYLRRHVPAAYDRQRPQPRHRLVRHARRRMARAQSRFRALARTGKF